MREESVVVLGWEGRTQRNAPYDVTRPRHARHGAVRTRCHAEVSALVLMVKVPDDKAYCGATGLKLGTRPVLVVLNAI